MAQVTELKESFAEMALEQKKSRSPPVNRNEPSEPAQYPPLPEGFGTHKTYYALGWKCTYDEEASYANPSGVHVDMERLERRSGYPHLYCMLAVPEGDPIPDNPYDESIPLDQILAISVTASRYLYYKRPTQAQYERLVKFFGEEPQWFRDPLPKKDFHMYGLT